MKGSIDATDSFYINIAHKTTGMRKQENILCTERSYMYALCVHTFVQI